MNRLKAKLKEQGGFVLAELLILMTALAIPTGFQVRYQVFERDRHAIDCANERAAQAEVFVEYLTNGEQAGEYKYNMAEGKLEPLTETGIAPYGKHGSHVTEIIFIRIDRDGNAEIRWGDPAVTAFDEATDTTQCGAYLDTVNHP